MFKILAIGLILSTFIGGGIVGMTMMDDDYGHMRGHHQYMHGDCEEYMDEDCEFESYEDCEAYDEECEEHHNEECDHHYDYGRN
jgi:hypothetical protein